MKEIILQHQTQKKSKEIIDMLTFIIVNANCSETDHDVAFCDNTLCKTSLL